MLEASFSLDNYHPDKRPRPFIKQQVTNNNDHGEWEERTDNGQHLHTISNHRKQLKKLIVTKPCSEAVASLTGSADFLSVLGITLHED